MTKTQDIRNQPAYTVAEAARYLKVATATLRSWVVGRAYSRDQKAAHSRPLIKPAMNPPPMLSFWNLIEAHALCSLRTDHGVPMPELRRAIQYTEKTLGVEHLLLRPELRTDAGKLLLEHYGELIELSASGQIAMKHTFNEHLARVEWDDWQFPVRLYPFASSSAVGAAQRAIAISAHISFGRPVLASRSISTHIIAQRLDLGETPVELAEDYGLTTDEIEQAALYERAA